MAFTVDFGPSEGGSSDQEKKKLALRDRIGRFAPTKVKKQALVAPVQQQQPLKDNTNHIAAAVKDLKDEVMILDEENNIKNDIDAEAIEPAVSDAGTYTIDDEEEDPKDDPDLDDVENRDKGQFFSERKRHNCPASIRPNKPRLFFLNFLLDKGKIGDVMLHFRNLIIHSQIPTLACLTTIV